MCKVRVACVHTAVALSGSRSQTSIDQAPFFVLGCEAPSVPGAFGVYSTTPRNRPVRGCGGCAGVWYVCVCRVWCVCVCRVCMCAECEAPSVPVCLVCSRYV